MTLFKIMSQTTIHTVQAALAKVIDRESGKSVTESGMISGITVHNGTVSFLITIELQEKERKSYLREECERAVAKLPGVKKVMAVLTAQSADSALNDHQKAHIARHPEQEARAKAQWNLTPLADVKKIIAVASGKGGVGKSTTAVGLAFALQQAGRKVGLLDADIYGPSIPRMMGLSGKPEVKDNKMQPLMAHGIACMSMGFIAGNDDAIVWRGPMLTKALHQMLRQVSWGGLDVLLVDMPPGTGDIHISMVQQVPLDGAIIVTTPQEVATMDARKCLQMFQKMNVPIVGVIENMSYFIDPASGNKSHIFGEGGGKKLAAEFGLAFLGEVPIELGIREAMDGGYAAAHPYYNAIGKQLY